MKGLFETIYITTSNSQFFQSQTTLLYTYLRFTHDGFAKDVIETEESGAEEEDARSESVVEFVHTCVNSCQIGTLGIVKCGNTNDCFE